MHHTFFVTHDLIDIIVGAGTIGREFFVLERGSVDVTVNNEQRATLKGPCSFGEVALMHNGRRTATVTASAFLFPTRICTAVLLHLFINYLSLQCCTEGVLWVTQRANFDKILQAYPKNFPWMSHIQAVVFKVWVVTGVRGCMGKTIYYSYIRDVWVDMGVTSVERFADEV